MSQLKRYYKAILNVSFNKKNFVVTKNVPNMIKYFGQIELLLLNI